MHIDENLIRALPKAEVHVHLEGSLELADLLELAKAAGAPLPGPAATLFDVSTHDNPGAFENGTGGGASNGIGVTGLSGFLQFLDWEGSLVRSREQLARIAYRFAARQSASGVRYTDAIINPTHWAPWASDVAGLFDALASGLDEAEADGLATVNLCYSLLRTQSAEAGVRAATWLTENRPARVIALSIDGDERSAGRTGIRFAEAFDIAARGGLRRTVHAGESSGPEGVWDAIRLLHADRIDHGVRAIEDPELVDYLAEHEIPLGICPRSNLTLGIYPDLESHPLAELQRRGVIVTVNTDDPAPLGTRLENEWALVAGAYDWGLPELVTLAKASVAASFAPDDLQRSMLTAIDDAAVSLAPAFR
ncbi:adenosine deaminase [Subtercola boreus]|uniref:Adenosine deaminase n=1 Tax=Subtercola boreus TaxID=120213 RepID=A0A3E0W8B7_9MICO|nr:adenosine deaminase [Subtercola boreus]RFA18068.1 adenosine deaminase [Subtercola boreus]RFA18450.1 adenosine deaminase [Subtercola boreus]RFA24979.1 adenosine deaminase [Subtercola boreus]